MYCYIPICFAHVREKEGKQNSENTFRLLSGYDYYTATI